MPTSLRRPRASADLSEIWEFIGGDNIQRADEFTKDCEYHKEVAMIFRKTARTSAGSVRGVVSLFDMLRLTGIFVGVGWTFGIGPVASLATWMSSLIAGAIGVVLAWAMTAFTRKLARAESEVALAFAYATTFLAIAISGAVGGAFCYHFLHRV